MGLVDRRRVLKHRIQYRLQLDVKVVLKMYESCHFADAFVFFKLLCLKQLCKIFRISNWVSNAAVSSVAVVFSMILGM